MSTSTFTSSSTNTPPLSLSLQQQEPRNKPNLCRREAELIYLDILRLEAEARQRREAHLHTFRTHTAKTFLSKVMAKKAARLRSEQGLPPQEDEEPLQPNKPNFHLDLIRIENEREMVSANNHCRLMSASVGTPMIPRIPQLGVVGVQIPPEPIQTPTIVCPSGFKGLKFVNEFVIRFTPPECCGGPRNCEIFPSTPTSPTNPLKPLCFGRIDSDTEVFLQRIVRPSNNNEEETHPIPTPGKEDEVELLGMRLDLTTLEWTVTFPQMETPVAFIVKPKTPITPNQIYEVISGDGFAGYFNFGVELDQKSNDEEKEKVIGVKFLSPSLSPTASLYLPISSQRKDVAYRAATLTITSEEQLWASQKAVLLGVGLMVCWEQVQDLRRRQAWLRVLIFGGILLSILFGLLIIIVYIQRRED